MVYGYVLIKHILNVLWVSFMLIFILSYLHFTSCFVSMKVKYGVN